MPSSQSELEHQLIIRNRRQFMVPHVPAVSLRWALAFLAVIGFSVAVRGWAALQWTANFDSDEAIIGLMSRHILNGQIPTYYYGQNYLGSFDAILAALAMHLLGPTVPALRLGSVLLFGGFLVLHALLIRRLWGNAVAFVSMVVLALPAWRLFPCTFRPSVAFSLMACLGTLALLLATTLPSKNWQRSISLAALGFVVGFGVWTHPMTLMYVIPLVLTFWLHSPEWAALYGRWREYSSHVGYRMTALLPSILVLVLLGLGVLAFFAGGCQPQEVFVSLQRLSRALIVTVVGAVVVLFWRASHRQRQLLAGSACFVLGLIVGNSPQWYAWLFLNTPPTSAILDSCPDEIPGRLVLLLQEILPALWGTPLLVGSDLQQLHPLQLVSWGAVLVLMVGTLALFVWQTRRSWWTVAQLALLPPASQKDILIGLLYILPIALVVLSNNTKDVYSVRYLVITWQAGAVLLALLVVRVAAHRKLIGAALLLFWVCQVGGTNLIESAQQWNQQSDRYKPAATQELDVFLTERGVQGGYADYWVAYVLDFLSGERFAIATYNGLNRYPAYTQRVREMPVKAYIFWQGSVPAGGTDINILKRVLERGGANSFIEPWQGKVVRERKLVANWDVWVIEDR